MINVRITNETLKYLSEESATKLVEVTWKKFQGKCVGKFNRYYITTFGGDTKRFLVVFETDDKAVVMTYNEVLNFPALHQACKKIWGDDFENE